MDRILKGPLSDKSHEMRMNYVYIWAGGVAEELVESKKSEDPTLKVETADQLLDALQDCLTHSTFFREAREQFYAVKQLPDETTQKYYSRVLELFKAAKFPSQNDFMKVDKLIHGCYNKDCKRKLMGKGENASVADCLAIMKSYESVFVTMKNMDEPASLNAVGWKEKKDKRFNRRPRSPKKDDQNYKKSSKFDKKQSGERCTRCGKEGHSWKERDKCPAMGRECNKCKKRNHFEKMCYIDCSSDEDEKNERKQHAVKIWENDFGSDDEEIIYQI